MEKLVELSESYSFRINQELDNTPFSDRYMMFSYIQAKQATANRRKTRMEVKLVCYLGNMFAIQAIKTGSIKKTGKRN